MAEKNFKITGGLALGDYALTANSLALLWDGNAIATQAYVDSVTPTVNTSAIAESLASATLWVSDGDNLNVNVNAFVGDLAGIGLYVNGVTLAVNTNAVATKDYVDSVAQGLDVKASVKVASVSNIDIATWNPMSQIDGTNINIPDRVLLKNQTDKSQNGIYTPDTSGTLVRATDADTTADFNKGAFTFVEEGTNAGKGFVVTAAGTLGTDEISWSQFSEAGSLTAGTNIYLANNEINVNVNALVGDLDGAGLYVDGVTLAVNTNVIATKEYVDSVAQGLDVKKSVRVATTADSYFLNSFAAGEEIDGVTLVLGDRILIKNQTDAQYNGIYTVNEFNTTPTRAEDANSTAKLNKGAFTFVEEGTSAGKGFVVTAAGTLETDAITWSQFSEAGALTAGPGIYITDGAIFVNVNTLAGSGLSNEYGQISVNAGTGLFINDDYVFVNTNTLAGSGLSSVGTQLAVDVDYLAGGPGLYSQEGQIRINPYAEGIRYDGEDGSGQNAQVVTDTFYGSTTDANTYVTVATFQRNVGFVADIWMKIPGTSLSRKSTVSGTADNSGNVEYTEYAIVDSATPLGSPDIAIQYSNLTNIYSIVAKSDLASEETLAVFVDLKTLSSPI